MHKLTRVAQTWYLYLSFLRLWYWTWRSNSKLCIFVCKPTRRFYYQSQCRWIQTNPDQRPFTCISTTLFIKFLMYERFTSSNLEDMQHSYSLPRNKTWFHHKLSNQCVCDFCIFWSFVDNIVPSGFFKFDLCQPTSLGICHPSALHRCIWIND